MRLRKQKRHRKTVRFYKACFGFREPFKVLCDGTFVHHLVVNRMTPPDDAMSNVLGGITKLFTTRCVLAELKSLGDSYSESLRLAHSLATARCDHERRKSAVACIMDIIGENNAEHFFVATTDTDLRKKFQEIPGVPVVFGLRNALFLEPPSAFQRQFVKSAEEERSHMTELEYKMLNKGAQNKMATKEAMDSSNANEGPGDQILGTHDMMKINTVGKKMVVKDKVQFKRKKVKGPNPLSCLKKKSHEQPHPNIASKKESKHDSKTGRSRPRKRKRSRGVKRFEEADS